MVGGAVGVALAVWLLRNYGLGRILDVLGRAGWLGVIAIVSFHLPQMLCSALGWQAIAASAGEPQPPLRSYFLLRWIREGVNNLLPLAQIGGEFIAARLLQRRGLPLAGAIAGTIADLLVEVATQILFTLLGVLLLVQLNGRGDFEGLALRGLLLATLVVAAACAAISLGAVAWLERAILRLGQSLGWPGTARIGGLHVALVGCYRSPSRIALAGAWHLASWLLGGIEVCLALHFLGRDVGIATGLVIESLGQAAKSIGFAVPGAVGVQEGGYVVICGVLGIEPQIAIALSLLKRLRELLLGIPGLVLWQRASGRAAMAPLA